jgi:hypothetical protein
MLASLAEKDVRYPVGDFRIDPDVTASKRRRWLQQMAETPAMVAAAVRGLDGRQMDSGSRLRAGEWTARAGTRRAGPSAP